ncbi:hypothetical protein GQ53DRAFT_244624 [Thozetella sp. PMI_491]|nr:hypothetical protein GQ53DRAFT_244624 [Thozetella sp. PMI_491]
MDSRIGDGKSPGMMGPPSRRHKHPRIPPRPSPVSPVKERVRATSEPDQRETRLASRHQLVVGLGSWSMRRCRVLSLSYPLAPPNGPGAWVPGIIVFFFRSPSLLSALTSPCVASERT